MGEADWRTKALWTLEEWVRADEEGREPVCPWETPRTPAEEEEERRLWAIAEARQPPLPEDASPEAQMEAIMDSLQEVMRLQQEIKKWRLLPGRGDPPFLKAVDRGRSDEEEEREGKKLYGIEDAFPVRFPVRRE